MLDTNTFQYIYNKTLFKVWNSSQLSIVSLMKVEKLNFSRKSVLISIEHLLFEIDLYQLMKEGFLFMQTIETDHIYRENPIRIVLSSLDQSIKKRV